MNLDKNPHYKKSAKQKAEEKNFNFKPMHNNDIEIHQPLKKKERVYKKNNLV
jgi:hypothetical protein